MTPIQEALKDYLETASTAFKNPDREFGSFEEFLLKRGKLIESAPLTKEVADDLWGLLRLTTFEIKRCYWNAQQIVHWHDDCQYYEGYALQAGLIPMHHAWVVYEGVVVDVTWRPGLHELAGRRSKKTLIRHLTSNASEVAYWGLPVERKKVRIRYSSRRAGEDFLGDMIREREEGRRKALRAAIKGGSGVPVPSHDVGRPGG